MADNRFIVQRVNTNNILYDLLTKLLPGWNDFKLRSRIMYSYNPNIY